MLFILAMEPLQCMFEQATAQEVLSPLNLRVARLRASFYADAALFVNPLKNDIMVVQQTLKLFGDVLGSRTSLKKCVAYPVACDGLDIANVLQGFCGAQGVF
jgi:hypothetical protein